MWSSRALLGQSRAGTLVELLSSAWTIEGRHPCGTLELCLDNRGPAPLWSSRALLERSRTGALVELLGPSTLVKDRGQNLCPRALHRQSGASTLVEGRQGPAPSLEFRYRGQPRQLWATISMDCQSSASTLADRHRQSGASSLVEFPSSARVVMGQHSRQSWASTFLDIPWAQRH